MQAWVLSGLFIAAIAGLVLVGQLPPVIFFLYLGASFVAFIAYAWDKSAARNDRWGTAEQTLHLFSLLGGWPGALAARQIFRHKSKKRSFIARFWATAVLNIAALAWLLSSQGRSALESILGAW